MDPEVHKKTKSIVEKLTENYAALQAHYQAAYLGWCGNPCSKEAEKAYQDAKALICEKEFALKEIELNTSRITEKVQAELPKKQKKPAKKVAKKAHAMEGSGAGKIRYRIKPSCPEEVHSERIFIPMADIDSLETLVSKLKI